MAAVGGAGPMGLLSWLASLEETIMLSKVGTLKSYKLDGRDGEVGKISEFFFDDRHWAIRYLVADTGNWLTGRQVLISPYALVALNKDRQNIEIDLTKKQIENSPSLNTDEPVSRQFESAYYGYYGWPEYWSGPFMWGPYPYLTRDREQWEQGNQGEKPWDPNLRSTDDVTGHHIQAADGEIGHVEDFILDDESWVIRYLVDGEAGSGFAAMDHARQLGRGEGLHQSFARRHQEVARVQRSVSANAGLREQTASALRSPRILDWR